VLDLVERPDRGEAGSTRRRRLDVERDVLALGEPGEAPVGAVADDRVQSGEVRQAIAQELACGDNVVRPSGACPGGDG
jgi:hypothetical protein